LKTQLHSIVVPVYQSASTLESLVKRVCRVMNNAQIDFELLLIDDGSRDGSFKEIKRLASTRSFVRGFRLSRNFGHQEALAIALQKSRGEFIAIIDDDLQDPPEILPAFFKKLYDGADVAYGIRIKRKESILKRALYSIFYKIFNILSNSKIPVNSGDFCTMKRCVVDAMLQLHDASPFLRGTRSWVGFKQVGIKYERAARLQGESTYTYAKYFKLAMTGIIMFSYVPLRIVMYLGLVASLSAFFYATFIITYWLVKPFNVPGYLSLLVVVTLLGGIQLVCIGIIGEYLVRLNNNIRNWPVAFIAETTGKDQT
jgi:polyisoprenyl-phosphate glycosyltransferase